ncbi:MAG: hypothetical protein LBU05_04750 [Bifidobacteriaceae bacterium]|nr:hypothetical protein [Bifidobacteriaceae bacterium]
MTPAAAARRRRTEDVGQSAHDGDRSRAADAVRLGTSSDYLTLATASAA